MFSLYIYRQPLSTERVGNLTGQCNTNCGCMANQFDPVCSVNGITYFSPCHAGCQVINATDSLEHQVRNAPIEQLHSLQIIEFLFDGSYNSR